jgi:predicted MPP superfamily phosphohydrolase
LRRRRGRWLAILLLAGCAVFAWARFVEPHWIRVQRTTLVGTGAQARLALISDLHLGIYKRRDDLRRVVDRINALQVHAVLIAGDPT